MDLKESHKNYSSKYLILFVNSGKFNEAFIIQKTRKKNLDSFESDLIIGVYFILKTKIMI